MACILKRMEFQAMARMLVNVPVYVQSIIIIICRNSHGAQ